MWGGGGGGGGGGGESELIVCITNVKGLKENRCVFFVAILWIL